MAVQASMQKCTPDPPMQCVFGSGDVPSSSQRGDQGAGRPPTPNTPDKVGYETLVYLRFRCNIFTPRSLFKENIVNSYQKCMNCPYKYLAVANIYLISMSMLSYALDADFYY